MDVESRDQLARLIQTSRFAALGTLYEGAPYVSLVLYAASAEMTAFYIHISGLATHTQNLLTHQGVSLMIHEEGGDARDPQTLARVSIRGIASPIKPDEDQFEKAKATYVAKNPQTANNFALGDFVLVEIQPEGARFVGGFARILNLSLDDLRQVGSS